MLQRSAAMQLAEIVRAAAQRSSSLPAVAPRDLCECDIRLGVCRVCGMCPVCCFHLANERSPE